MFIKVHITSVKEDASPVALYINTTKIAYYINNTTCTKVVMDKDIFYVLETAEEITRLILGKDL